MAVLGRFTVVCDYDCDMVLGFGTGWSDEGFAVDFRRSVKQDPFTYAKFPKPAGQWKHVVSTSRASSVSSGYSG